MSNSGIDVSEALQKVRDSRLFVNTEQAEQTNELSALLDKVFEYLSDMKNNFFDWLESIFPKLDIQASGFGDNIINFVSWGLIVLFLIVLLIVLVKLVENYRKKEKEELISLINIETGKLDSHSWIDLARNTAAKAQYREACRAVYMALIFNLDENGVIKYDNAKTNLEYLQVVKTNTELYTPLKQVVTVFEYLWYGKHAGTSSDYEMCIDFYKKVANE